MIIKQHTFNLNNQFTYSRYRPKDDYTAEYNAYCQRMGYTREKMNSIRYKMTVYDEFMAEYQYRKKYYGVRDDSRSISVQKSRETR